MIWAVDTESGGNTRVRNRTLATLGGPQLVSQKDVGDGARDASLEVLRGRGPRAVAADDRLQRGDQQVGIRPAHDVAAAFDRFRPLGDVTKGDVRHAEDAALFLDRTAVAHHAAGVSLELHEVEEAERLDQLHSG